MILRQPSISRMCKSLSIDTQCLLPLKTDASGGWGFGGVLKSGVCSGGVESLCEAVHHAVETRDKSSLEEDEDEGEAPTISFRKWRLGDQGRTADAALLGI